MDLRSHPTLTPIHRRDAGPVRVAIAGGGFAAAEALIALRTLAGERVAIDLVAPNPDVVLRPLSVAAAFGPEELHGRPLAELCADHDATLHGGALSFVDVPCRRLETDRGERIAYDAAIVAVGGRTRATIDGRCASTAGAASPSCAGCWPSSTSAGSRRSRSRSPRA